MKVQITDRSRDCFRLLDAARWLATSQVHRRYFRHATPDATRQWLRKHGRSGYIRVYRRDRMSEALFTLGPLGVRVLERGGIGARPLERAMPKHIEHLLGINDIRIAAELGLDLTYFYACWELPALQWREAVIPDALFSAGGRVFAVEYDRGLETHACFLRKITVYRTGFSGLPLTSVLIVTDSTTRMRALAHAIPNGSRLFRFATLSQVRQYAFDVPVFCRDPQGSAEKLT